MELENHEDCLDWGNEVAVTTFCESVLTVLTVNCYYPLQKLANQENLRAPVKLG